MARIKVISPSGKPGSIPEEQLDAAIAQGYKRADAAPTEHAAEAAEPVADAEGPTDSDSDGMLMSGLKQIPGFLGGIVKGAAKGAGNMAVGAGEMIHKIPGVTEGIDALYGQPGLSETAFGEAKRELQPHGVGEHIGKFGTDVAALALAPGGSIPAAMASNAVVTGTQTGGDPTSMAVSGGLAGLGGLAAKILNRTATGTARGQAEIVSAKRTADAAKKAAKQQGTPPANAMNDPMWMQAQEGNTARFTELIRKYGITGQPEKDIAIIAKAPAREQEVLSALSRQMNPAKHQLGHEWSMAELLGNSLPAGIAGTAAAGPLGGASATAGILLVRSLMKKYPGIAAKLLGQAADVAPRSGQIVGGLAGKGAEADDPMVAELMRRER